jgi:pimeloyl-ACP methyl ester carboxylesterase
MKALGSTMTSIYPYAWLGEWRWQQMGVSFIDTAQPTAGKPESSQSTVLLIHGFGANKEHWRHNVVELASSHRVIAIDLIGFGSSEKPRSKLKHEHNADGWSYGMDSWGQQIVDFIQAHIDGPVHLIGNSIGGVVALNAARLLEERNTPARQIILIDCAQRTLDDKRLLEQPRIKRWFRPILKGLVQQRWLTSRLFQALATAGTIRTVLQRAYPSGHNSDEQLVDLLLKPAQEANAAEAFRGFINLFDDRIAPHLLADLQTPVAILHGALDPWEKSNEAAAWLNFPCVTSFRILEGLGHCPHDEGPDVVNPLLISLLAQADAAHGEAPAS